MTPLINLQNVNFSYPCIHQHSQSLFQRDKRSSIGEYHALHDINLTIQNGERVGLIGKNGSGKSTLLRLMAGVYKPDTGIHRRIGKTFAIIDPNLGLDVNFSGRENIYTIGIMAGISEREINRKISEIMDFTELDEFFDEPVSTYSQGMRARLGFAINCMASPDILLSDEYLTTGDIFFREKAEKKIDTLYKSNIVVFASHSQVLLEKICNRAVVIEKGKIIFDGDINQAQDMYKNMS